MLAYRGGLDIEPDAPTDTEVVQAAERWLPEVASSGRARLTDRVLLRFGIWEAVRTGRPLQVHTGFGDTDLDLHRADPALLTPFLRATEGLCPVLLLHTYPFHRTAGYLAQMFGHVHMDVGLALHHTGAASERDRGRVTGAGAAHASILYSSDAWGLPELHLLGSWLFRRGLSRSWAAGSVPATGRWRTPSGHRGLVGWANAGASTASAPELPARTSTADPGGDFPKPGPVGTIGRPEHTRIQKERHACTFVIASPRSREQPCRRDDLRPSRSPRAPPRAALAHRWRFALTGAESRARCPCRNGASSPSRRSTPRAVSSARPSSSSSTTASTTWPSRPRPRSSSWRRTTSRRSSATPTRTRCWPRRNIFQDAGIPYITVGATSPKIPSQTVTWCSWPAFGDNVQAAAGAEYALQNFGNTAYLLSDNGIEYTTLLGGYFKDAFTAAGGTIVLEDVYADDATDFSSQITKVKALPEQPDFYYIAAMPYNVGPVVKQFRDAGLTGTHRGWRRLRHPRPGARCRAPRLTTCTSRPMR